MSNARVRRIRVDTLARVEGEGALDVRIRDGKVTDLKFRIYEPPRFFEAFLRGRSFTEVPDITARICGICPIAYMLGASQAIEDIAGVTVGGSLRDLRRLIYCGEWIESHVLHAAMLHAPDFLGFQDALQLAKQSPDIVNKALAVKKMGNHILEAVGGRAIHPVNLKVGGFYRAPKKRAIRGLIEPLRQSLSMAIDLANTFSTLEYPDLEQDYIFVSLKHPDEYAIHEGRVVSNTGLDIAISDYRTHFQEEHVSYSTALQGSLTSGQPYMVGPLARYANNYDQLSSLAKDVAANAGLGAVVRNPYRSLLVRMVETVYALEEAIRLADAYEEPEVAAVEVSPRSGVGHGATEAPRGVCYHRYRTDDQGTIVDALIVPPTSQNQRQIEEDLRRVVEANLTMTDDTLQWRCEQTIRNYDPCISCATHFLKLTVDRGQNGQSRESGD